MEWFKDPKNQPIVAGILIVIILAAVGLVIFMNTRDSGGGGETTVDPYAQGTPTPDGSMPAPGMPPGAPPGMPPGTPAAAPTTPPASSPTPSTPAAPAEAPVNVASLERSRPDPFLPFDWKPTPKLKEIVRIPMPGRMFPAKAKVPEGLDADPEPPQPPRRMAGILFRDRVYAIIETSGPAGSTTMIVRPGDITDDGMRVERIEPNKVVLATTSGKFRRVDVKMAPSQKQEDATTGLEPGSTSSPYMPYGPRPPYGRPPGMMPGPEGPGAVMM